MKTDREVLLEAADILAADNGWCQHKFSKFTDETDKTSPVSYCAEGALMKAIGYVEDVRNLQYDHWLPPRYDIEFLMPAIEDRVKISKQYERLREQLGQQLIPLMREDEDSYETNGMWPRSYNDAEYASKEEIILAMKTLAEEKA